MTAAVATAILDRMHLLLDKPDKVCPLLAALAHACSPEAGRRWSVVAPTNVYEGCHALFKAVNWGNPAVSQVPDVTLGTFSHGCGAHSPKEGDSKPMQCDNCR
jgi:hypothetical protein